MSEFFIEIEGKKYGGWVDVTVTKSIENLCGTFQFTATAIDGNDTFPIKRRSACRIYIDDTPVINGYVEVCDPVYTLQEHTITISGRDRTCDLLDSQLDTVIKLTTPISFKTMCEKVLSYLHMSDVKVVNPYSLPQINAIQAYDLGITGFDLLEKYAKQVGVLLTTNLAGNLKFQRSDDLPQYKTILTFDRKSKGTLLESRSHYDDTKRFHTYKIVGQTNNVYIAVINGELTAKNVNVTPKPSVVDNEIRQSRVFTFQPETNGDEQTLKKRAQWEANFRRAQSQSWNYVVQDVYPLNDAVIWQPGYLVRVHDVFGDVNSILLISEVTYTLSLDSGLRTTLKCVTKDAFSLQVNKPEKEKKDDTEGLNLLSKLE